MTGQAIAQLLIIFGPEALGLIHSLAANWNKELTLDEVMSICSVASKSLEDYRREARAKLQALGQLPPEQPRSIPGA